MYKSNFPTCGRAGQKSRMEFLQQLHGHFSHDAEDCLMTIARIFHELLSRDHEDGCATWQLVPRYRGIGFRGVPERYVAGTDIRGRQEGRPHPWSQQVIHEISGLTWGAELL